MDLNPLLAGALKGFNESRQAKRQAEEQKMLLDMQKQEFAERKQKRQMEMMVLKEQLRQKQLQDEARANYKSRKAAKDTAAAPDPLQNLPSQYGSHLMEGTTGGMGDSFNFDGGSQVVEQIARAQGGYPVFPEDEASFLREHGLDAELKVLKAQYNREVEKAKYLQQERNNHRIGSQGQQRIDIALASLDQRIAAMGEDIRQFELTHGAKMGKVGTLPATQGGRPGVIRVNEQTQLPVPGEAFIPTGEKKPLTAETAAKLELAQGGLEDFYRAKDIIMPGGKVDRMAVANMAAATPFTQGRTAGQALKNSVEGKLRAESGAAVPEDEVKRAAKRLIASVWDTERGIEWKMERLEGFLMGTVQKMDPNKNYSKEYPVLKGKDGANYVLVPKQKPKRLKYNPDTDTFE
jgi:hypothetical protein